MPVTRRKLFIAPIVAATTTSTVAMPTLLNTKAAAAYFGISIRTLRRWKKMGDITSVKYPGSLRFEVAAIEDFLARRRIKAGGRK